MASKHKLRLLHNPPHPHTLVSSTGCDRSLPKQAVNGCNRVLVAIPASHNEEQTRARCSRHAASDCSGVVRIQISNKHTHMQLQFHCVSLFYSVSQLCASTYVKMDQSNTLSWNTLKFCTESYNCLALTESLHRTFRRGSTV